MNDLSQIYAAYKRGELLGIELFSMLIGSENQDIELFITSICLENNLLKIISRFLKGYPADEDDKDWQPELFVTSIAPSAYTINKIRNNIKILRSAINEHEKSN